MYVEGEHCCEAWVYDPEIWEGTDGIGIKKGLPKANMKRPFYGFIIALFTGSFGVVCQELCQSAVC